MLVGVKRRSDDSSDDSAKEPAATTTTTTTRLEEEIRAFVYPVSAMWRASRAAGRSAGVHARPVTASANLQIEG